TALAAGMLHWLASGVSGSDYSSRRGRTALGQGTGLGLRKNGPRYAPFFSRCLQPISVGGPAGKRGVGLLALEMLATHAGLEHSLARRHCALRADPVTGGMSESFTKSLSSIH